MYLVADIITQFFIKKMYEQYISSKFQGKDFKNKNLEDSDFSKADIRGINFSGANLTNTKFRKVQAGLTPLWKYIFASFCCFLAFLAGLISAYGGAVIGHLVMDNTQQLPLFGFLGSITLFVFLFMVATRGLGTLRSLAELMAATLIAVTFLVAVIAFAPTEDSGSKIALGAALTVLGLTGIIAGILDMALGVATAREINLFRSKLPLVGLAIAGAILGALFGVGVKEEISYVISGIIAIVTIILGINIGSQANSNQEKYWLIRWLAINIVSWKSTKFVGANLTDADFTGADLTHTDFSNANLTRTCWSQAKGLDFARREVSSSYEIVELSVGDSINPQAAALTLQQIKQKYADKVELLAIEGTEQNNLKFHTKIMESDSSIQIANELKQMYRQNQLLPDSTREQILLKENYQLLEKILTKAIEKPTYYQNINIAKGNYIENIKGDYTDNSRNLEISGNAQVKASGAGAFSLGDNYKTIANTVSQSLSNKPDKEKLNGLLKQLQRNVSETDLANEDKEYTLKQIKLISTALANAQNITQKKIARQAMKLIRGVAASLPPSSKFVVMCNQLPELISKIF